MCVVGVFPSHDKKTDGEILNAIIEEKSGLQEACEEMVAIKEVMEPLCTPNEIPNIVKDILAAKDSLIKDNDE